MIEGKVVIMTGAAKGIGRYVSNTFAEAGAKLAVVDILSLETVTSEIQGHGAEVLPVHADVRNEEQVAAMAEQVASHFGRIDVLVNNAGIATHSAWEPRWPRIQFMEKSFWDKVMETNLTGTFLCAKHVLPHMEEQRSGVILNVSGGEKLTPPGGCLYATSKGAVRTFTRYLAAEEREWNVCVALMSPSAGPAVVSDPNEYVGIITDEAPQEVRRRYPHLGPHLVGNRFVLAAQIGMELTGHSLSFKDGKIVGEPL